ncbi:hypothetical protein AB9F26_05970 [Falsihalocynthiibacter sp. BN13B15]|uniref:hypothetical protein n=1 Tax=Falsihalocynthiibacter sp. BN13B15 TaxID=3240871 RepID=UPI00351026AB
MPYHVPDIDELSEMMRYAARENQAAKHRDKPRGVQLAAANPTDDYSKPTRRARIVCCYCDRTISRKHSTPVGDNDRICRDPACAQKLANWKQSKSRSASSVYQNAL